MSKSKTSKGACISGAAMRAATQFVSTEETRYYLQGVHCQARKGGGVILTATNGHILGRVFDPDGAWPFEPAILAFDRGALALMKRDRKATQTPAIEIAPDVELKPGQIAVSIGGRPSDARVVDGSFPDVDRVIPKGAPKACAEPYAFDHSYVHRFGVAGKELGACNGSVAIWRVEAHNAPHLVRVGDVENLFGVIMPIGTKLDRLPAWQTGGKALEKSVRISNKPARKAAEPPADPAPIATGPAKVSRSKKPLYVPPRPEDRPRRARLSESERLQRVMERRAYRQRLRAVLGRGVRLSHLSEKEREAAKAKAREPLQRMSLAAISKAAPRIVAPTGKVTRTKATPRLIFEARHRADLLAGRKTSTVRRRSPHTARFTEGLRVPVESPNGDRIGETTIRKVEADPKLTAAERKRLARIYGKAEGAFVRLTFSRVKAAKAARAPARRR